MNKSYISPTKLACLALVCMVGTLTNGFDALILCVIAAAAFLFAIAIVSNLEKVATNHVRFIIYAIIVSAMFTVMKIVFGYIKSLELLELAELLDYAFLSSLVLSIMPIYFIHKESTSAYYSKSILSALIFMVSGIVIASIIELMTHGTIFGLFIVESSISVLSAPFVIFILIAIVAVIGTASENRITKTRSEERLLIDKYKVMIREHQLKKFERESKNKADSTLSDNIEGGNE